MELDRVSNVPAVVGVVSDVEEDALPDGLSEPQVMVLKLVASGRTLTDAAKGAGVSRMAVYRWMRDSEPFITAQRRIREQMMRGVKMDIAALAEDALVNVQMAVAAGNDPRLCLALLKYMGLLKPPEESGDRP